MKYSIDCVHLNIPWTRRQKLIPSTHPLSRARVNSLPSHYPPYIPTQQPRRSTGMARSSYVEALLGADTFEKVRNTKILVVGAGGIGCELRMSPLAWLTIY